MTHSKKSTNFILALTMLLFVSAVLAGCNTMEGFGEDTEAAGEAIQDAAND